MERADAPAPLRRRGPRPLALHLILATLKLSASAGSYPPSSPDSANWNGGENPAPAEAGHTTSAEAVGEQAALIRGIAAYRRHAWTRELPDPPTIWREGDSRILDFGGDSPVALFVPSLINRAYVLDLAEGHSLLRWLATRGVRPLLLEWGWPGDVERRFSLTDYIAGRLERALAAVAGLARGSVVLVGYCMGGLLALAAAQRRSDLVSRLALLATPWDFHIGETERARQAAAMLAWLEPAMASGRPLSVDLLQTLFTMLDPDGVAEKYRAFARLDPDSKRARLFVALEDWLNDGVPLAAPVARECLEDWYGRNTPASLEWRVAGEVIDPARTRMPVFVAVPQRDKIVPPESARPLAACIQGARLHEPQAGHIGMIAGMGAERELWAPLRDWLHQD